MPAPTPSTMRAGMFPARRQGSALGRLHGGQQPPPDLAERDRQGLLLHAGFDQRPDVLQQALAELGVVGIDLPRPLGRDDDEAVLAVDDVEQVVDGRVGDAVRSGIACHRLPSVSVFWPDQAVIKVTSCPHTSLTDVLTSVMSNSWPASIALAASSSRRAMTSGGSVPRAERRRTSSSQEGGARKTRSASATARRTCLAPSMSISSSAGTPAAMRRATGSRGVPERCPA